MCKKQTEKSKENNKKQQDEVGSPAKWVFSFVAIVFSLTMAFLIVWEVILKEKEVHEVNLTLTIPENTSDSLSVDHLMSMNYDQLKQLVSEIETQSERLYEKYEAQIKTKEIESDFFRLISCVAAFVATLLGFLGYKTIKDIENKAQSLAELKAEEKAISYTKEHLESEVEKQLKDIVGDSTAAKLIKEQILNDIIPTHINKLESRINDLDSKINNGSTKTEDIPIEEEQSRAFGPIDEEIVNINEIEGDNNNE